MICNCRMTLSIV